MKKLVVILFAFISFNSFAQKVEKDLKYYYYYANQDKDFNAYLKARKLFDNKKYDFQLPSSKDAVQELSENEAKIFKNEKTYAEFLSRYGMKNAGDYAKMWFNQMETLKTFIKKNPEFYKLTPKERQSIIDKWYFAETAAN